MNQIDYQDNKLSINQENIKLALSDLKIVLFHQNTDLEYTWIYSPNFEEQFFEIGPDFMLFSKADEARHKIIKQNLILEKEHKSGTEYIYFNDSTKLIEWDYSPLIGLDGEIKGITGFIRDITSDKRSESRLKTIYDALPIGIAIIDHNGNIIEINRELLAYVHNVTHDYRPFDNLIDDLHSENNVLMSLLEYQAKQVINTKISVNDVEIYLTSEDNKSLWFSITSIPVEPSFDVAVVLVSDISYKKHIENEIKRSNNQLRVLSDYLEAVREEERKKIAFWIHDDIGQIFTGLKIDLSWLEVNFKEQVSDNSRERFKNMHKTIDETIKRVREISSNLRPPVLDHFGICVALEFQLQDLAERSGLNIIFNKSIEEIEMKEDRKIFLFRIMQELFINIIRHSEATEVELTITQDLDNMIIDLYDNGKSFNRETLSSPKSFGLMAIQERIRSLKGSIEFFLEENQGTRVNIRVPI